jgi:hypothetical protein
MQRNWLPVMLIENSPETLRTGIRTDNVAADLCSKFLQKDWRILTTDYRIQQPTSQPIARAWATLDAAFPPGCGDYSRRRISESSKPTKWL